MESDWKLLSSDLGDDPELAREVARVLCQAWPSLQRRLLDSLTLEDNIEKARSLHALKGALGVFPSNGFATKLSSIERHFRQDACDLALPELEKILPELESYISTLGDLLSKDAP
jgi:HPt (histidine-containing phosphotransfer) domain-containing protein